MIPAKIHFRSSGFNLIRVSAFHHQSNDSRKQRDAFNIYSSPRLDSNDVDIVCEFKIPIMMSHGFFVVTFKRS